MSESYFLFLGSANRATPYFATANGGGVSVVKFDADTLDSRKIAEFRDIENPTFLSIGDDGTRVYANSEVFNWREGLVTAFAFDKATFSLDYLNIQPSLGSITAQSIITRDQRYLMVVNYSAGNGGPDQSLAVYPLSENSSGLRPPVASVRQVGAGPDKERQDKSHAHSVTEVGDNIFVVADLGCDTLTSYRLTDDAQLVRLSERRCEAGAGPRHIAVDPNGRFIFVMNELNSTCASFSVDGRTGALTPINTAPALPDGATVQNYCADIQISPDGRFLYGSNRGHDSISLYSVAQETGEVALVDAFPCGGKTPRNLAITPTGRHLFSANQDTDRITIFVRNTKDGRLIDTGKFIETGTPMCVKIAKA